MLTAQRHKELHNQLTNIAKKVYDSVPKNTAWSIKQITTDVYTQTGARNDIRVVMCCLNSLVDSGLVLNDGQDNFKRAPIKEIKSLTDLKDIMPSNPEPNKEDKQVDPLLGLLEIATDLRKKANLIEQYVAQADARISAPSTELEELRQMRNLLKKITS